MKTTKKILAVVVFIFLFAVPVSAGVTPAEATKIVKSAVMNRQPEVSVAITVTDKTLYGDVYGVSKSVFKDVFRYTGNPDEGDSLFSSIFKASIQNGYCKTDGDFISIDVTYRFQYNDTVAQRKKANSAIKKALKKLKLSGKSKKEKVRLIYDYICKTVKYDYAEGKRKNVKTLSDYTAYGAIVNRKAVCQGYADLFYKMCLYSGIQCRIVAGTVAGSDFGHAWNIVKVGTKWYNCDVTWDCDNIKSGYQWFMKGNEDFSFHYPDFDFSDGTSLMDYDVSSKSLNIKNVGKGKSSKKKKK